MIGFTVWKFSRSLRRAAQNPVYSIAFDVENVLNIFFFQVATKAKERLGVGMLPGG